MRIGLLFLLPLLASCAGINPKPVTGPHGRPAYEMQCSGLGRTLEACHAKAAELCPDGYTVFAQASETVVVPLMDGGKLSVPERSIRIECD
jgi:hypothetical protein